MRPIARTAPWILAGLLAVAAPASGQAPPSPEEFLGFEIGADRQLADYRQIRSYLRALAAASPRVEVVTLGETTLGEEMVMAVVTSEENHRNLHRIREIAARLADPRGLSEPEAEALVAEGKAILLVICSIHSDEIGPSQTAVQWAWSLATAEDAATVRRLDEAVLLLVPSANPDGQIMETEWYRRWLGTPYEGGQMPWLYHAYAGHDNNRDWFMLTQVETRLLNRAMYHEWFPHVVIDEHQMGSDGPRMFVPPFADPMDPGIHPLIWREIEGIGATMALRLEQAGKRGVIHGYRFDAYWIGGTRNTPWWKNVTGLLTEIASADRASPVHVEPSELEGESKGLVGYGPRVNHPNPWPGGWWRLADIVEYGRIASDAALEWVAEHREDVLANMLTRARDAIAEARPGEAYRIPAGQRDPAAALGLARLLAEHGVEVREAAGGELWVPLAQPYARLVRELLEPQRYPETRLVPGGVTLRPYDVSAWTLPLMTGVTVERATLPAGLETRPLAAAPVAPAWGGAAYGVVDRGSVDAVRAINAGLAAGGRVWTADRGRDGAGGAHAWLDRRAAEAAASVAAAVGLPLLPADAPPPGARPLRRPRVATYQPWTASMDEGWTRWVLETHGFEVTPLHDAEIRAGGLADRFDAIVLPDLEPAVLADGEPEPREEAIAYRRPRPPAYRGGLGEPGLEALRAFVAAGGTLVALDTASEYVVEGFDLPVRNALAGREGDAFDAPGTLLRAEVRPGHPVTAGLPGEIAVFLDDDTAFETRWPGPVIERTVLATYPAEGRDVLLSGWIEGAERLERRAAAVAIERGGGKIVLLGFRPQHRGWTRATFPFLFNALYWAAER